MPHKSDPPPSPWPEIHEAYQDEFGPIDPDVYKLAADVWPLAESPSFRNLIDTEQLLIKAVAIVSRICVEQPGKVTNIKGYLYKTFSRLLLEQLRKQQRQEPIDSVLLEQVEGLTARSDGDTTRMILVNEIMQRADNWTREIFWGLVQGYTLEELAEIKHTKANLVRSKLSKNLSRIRKQIEKESRAAKKRILQRQRATPVAESFENK
jgi:DNA-directed RNA polymerase specialized sigma24 family protein